MPDPSELIFPDEPVFIPPESFAPGALSSPRRPMRPPFPPLCSVQGTVKNRFGFPIQGARCALYTSSSGNFRPIAETFTDRFGRFRFSWVRPGRYTVIARSRSRSARRNISVNARNCNLQNIDISL